ncbi:vasotab-like [Teleopsis dalmanni]|uniref:vasotab-like n=1 Tax=Teleopsis dalmanni TaxID=139649 RepID=UPI0018CF6D18|nr:vasotab-like [Teleopsis dalmanni]XP_037956952.1 vasotab-like [Teleopsis dalmanni]
MKFAILFLVFAFGFLAIEATCPLACTREYKPVCAELVERFRIRKCTFPNKCNLNARRCLKPNEAWRVRHPGACKSQSNQCKKLTKLS